MNHTSKDKYRTKFKGFTEGFPKLNETEGNFKQPFTGFTTAYKNAKPPDEEWDETETNCCFFNIPKLKPTSKPDKVIAGKNNNVADGHFKPTKYRIWSEIRFREALTRNRNEYGPIREAAQDGEHNITGNILLEKFKYYTARDEQYCRKYADYYDRGQCDYLHQRNDDITSQQQKVQHSYRNLNDYPQKYQFDLMNKRMKKFVTQQNTVGQSTETNSALTYVNLQPDYDKLAAERKELTEYMNTVVKPRNRKLNFEPENFSSWYSKFSFNFEKKYKNIPQATMITGDFSSWLGRVKETIHRGCYTPAEKNYEIKYRYERRESSGNMSSRVNSVFLRGWKPSISYCSTC